MGDVDLRLKHRTHDGEKLLLGTTNTTAATRRNRNESRGRGASTRNERGGSNTSLGMGPRTFKATSEAVKSRSKNRIFFEFSPSFPLPHARGAEVQICAVRNAVSDELNDLSKGAAN